MRERTQDGLSAYKAGATVQSIQAGMGPNKKTGSKIRALTSGKRRPEKKCSADGKEEGTSCRTKGDEKASKKNTCRLSRILLVSLRDVGTSRTRGPKDSKAKMHCFLTSLRNKTKI